MYTFSQLLSGQEHAKLLSQVLETSCDLKVCKRELKHIITLLSDLKWNLCQWQGEGSLGAEVQEEEGVEQPWEKEIT